MQPSSTGPYLSLSAADKVHALREEEHNPKLNLRVYITGGGCSGLQYGFTFDEHIAEDDTTVEQYCSDGKSKVNMVIDPASYSYLTQAEIDYKQGLQGEHFVIRNPDAKTTCGCGASFSVQDDEPDDDSKDEH